MHGLSLSISAGHWTARRVLCTMTGMASIAKRPDGRWRARYRDDTGREHSRHFTRKTDAQRWLDEVTASVVTGQYVDPRAGKVTFQVFAEDWRKAQPHGPLTRDRVEAELRLHVYPVIGHVSLARIRPSTVQAMVSGFALGASSAAVVLTTVRLVFTAARRDRLIAADPTEGVRTMPAAQTEAWIPAPGQVVALRENLPPRYQGVVDVVIGSGLRAGEVFGLEVGHVDFLRDRSLRVEQQLLANKQCLAPPKTAHSRRTVPLVAGTLNAVSAHLARFPAAGVDIRDATDPRRVVERSARLVFTTDSGRWVGGGWGKVWRPAARAAGFPPGSGLHSLRHFFASALIRHGESAKVVQRRLGHASPTVTWQTYVHLWPDSDDRTRSAIEAALANLADMGRTEDRGNASDLHG